MKTTLGDLNDYLFEVLDRISNDDLDDETLDREIKRADTTTKIARTIIDNANVALQFKKHCDEYGIKNNIGMQFLEAKEN